VNPPWYRQIDEFSRMTGVAVIMSMSLNLRGEAIVHTPTNALQTCFSSGRDALFLASLLIEK